MGWQDEFLKKMMRMLRIDLGSAGFSPRGSRSFVREVDADIVHFVQLQTVRFHADTKCFNLVAYGMSRLWQDCYRETLVPGPGWIPGWPLFEPNSPPFIEFDAGERRTVRTEDCIDTWVVRETDDVEAVLADVQAIVKSDLLPFLEDLDSLEAFASRILSDANALGHSYYIHRDHYLSLIQEALVRRDRV